MLIVLALLPVVAIAVLMVSFKLPAKYAMPIGWLIAAIIAFFGWEMPFRWIASATIGGIINALDILFIVFGAILLLQLMKKCGAITGISTSMAAVSKDRRVQMVLITWLMGSFFEGVAGFGTPAAIGAPLLAGLGFPPLVAVILALAANSTGTSFGAAGTPVLQGFGNLENLVDLSQHNNSFIVFLNEIGALAGIFHFIEGSFMALVLLCMMTLITEGSIKNGIKAWPFALFSGLIFTIPQLLLAVFVGPELPTLLGTLIAIPAFIFAATKGFLVPKTTWDFPDKSKWHKSWEGKVKAGTQDKPDRKIPGTLMSWLPYMLIGILLLIFRLEFFGIKQLLTKYGEIEWANILGTEISRGIKLFYNPGIMPFTLIALLIPFIYKMKFAETINAWKASVKIIAPAAISLVFTIGMVYIMMNTEAGTDKDNMLIVLAKAAAKSGQKAWYLIAPLVGVLGSFISGSNTVSDLMFGAFQYSTALEVGIPATVALALQAVGGAAGNMICVHNVVAALATVGLSGKEGLVIRRNFLVAVSYALVAGLVAWVFTSLLYHTLF